MEVISSESDEENEPPWRLVALEDTGELLDPDARTRVAQSLSRSHGSTPASLAARKGGGDNGIG